ncbi:MAG: M28 family peptidase [Bacteroidales bacterium]|nr:M28 family peptidase [Bacteroidales bacterium]
MKHTFLTITAALSFFGYCSFAQQPASFSSKLTLSPEITAKDLKTEIGYLASDSLKGRRPGMPGADLAAVYIRDVFRQSGLQLMAANGFQEFEVVSDVTSGTHNQLSFEDFTAELNKDFIPLSFSSSASLDAAVVFAGYGFDLDLDSLKWNDYKGFDVKGKWVLILRGDPEPEKQSSFFISYSQERLKALTAKDKGALGVLFVTPSDMEKTDGLMQIQFDKTPSDAGIPVFNITRATADRILASMNYTISDLETSIKENHQPSSLYLPINVKATSDVIQQKVTARNVVGLLKSSNTALNDEYIVIGAHYDHLGWGGENSGSRLPEEHAIHNGADDNASGTAGVLELAAKLASIRDVLGRSIIFIAFDGEEMGLLGSKEFTKHPTVDLKKIKTMINMDMIGRLNPASNAISVGGTGTSTESDTLIAMLSMNRSFESKRSPDGYGPSDHAAFYSENIPVFYFTTGAHDEYHTPSDDADKIAYDGEVEILGMVLDLAQELSQRSLPLQFREAGAKQGVRYGRNLKVTLGIVPDMVSSDNKGLRVDGVKKGGPAEKSGIVKGDVIVAMDGQPVTNIYDYMARLGKLKVGQVAAVEIMREGKKEIIIVQF